MWLRMRVDENNLVVFDAHDRRKREICGYVRVLTRITLCCSMLMTVGKGRYVVTYEC